MLVWALAITRRLAGRWRVVSLVLPALAGVAIAGAVARPVLRYESRARNVVILLDLSGSTRASPWRDPKWVRALAQRRLEAEVTVSVVGFAGTTRMLVDHVALDDEARWPTVWPVVDPDDVSDVTGALAWRSSEEARGAEAVAPRWLITDGLAALCGEDAAMPFAVTEISAAERLSRILAWSICDGWRRVSWIFRCARRVLPRDGWRFGAMGSPLRARC